MAGFLGRERVVEMKPPAFQFYPDDFTAGVSTMTQTEVGAYILLLCHQWSVGKISDELPRLEIVAKGKVSDHVLSKFPNGKNKRLEIERKKQQLFRESRSKNGKLGGRPCKASDNLVVLKTEPRKSSPSPSPSPSPIKQERSASLSLAEIQQVFDEWNLKAEKSGLPQCLLVSDKRRRFLESRLKNGFFRENWSRAIDRVAASGFCRGESDRGWRASFDWFITPDAVVKIMEGKYDSVEKPQEEQRAF